jgi:Ca2+/H+ antiporter, TMEM165/GDT1 family
MDWKIFFAAFGTIFLAELGDKTQLATLLYATQVKNPWMVFLGAAGALVLTTLLAVVFGEAIARYVPARVLRFAAGTGFLVVGVWVLVGAMRGGEK